MRYDASSITGFHGDTVDALSISSFCKSLGEPVGVHYLIYDADDLRGALKPGSNGRVQRGPIEAVRRLLEDTGAEAGSRPN